MKSTTCRGRQAWVCISVLPPANCMMLAIFIQSESQCPCLYNDNNSIALTL